jgi:choline monooxygenase
MVIGIAGLLRPAPPPAAARASILPHLRRYWAGEIAMHQPPRTAADAADELQPQPLAHATALPAHFYVDADAAARDARAVFARHWQLACHASRLAGIGDHVVLEVAGVPVLVVRSDAHAIRAFHNVCRHRAGPLARCDGLGARSLRCKYHGWTYGLDGQLRSATEMKDVPGFDVAAVRLPELRVHEWQGLVFVALGDAAPPFADVVDGIDARLGPEHAIAPLVLHHRSHYDVACNWKAYVDNYLEGYHVPHIHPGLNALLDYRSYVTTTARWHSLQFSPLESGDELYGRGEALYYFLYPNTMLNILPGRLQTNRVLPLGVDRCRIEFDFFYRPDPADEGAARRAADFAFSDEVQLEDVTICEDVQRGLASGSYVAGRLNPLRENAVHHFHELLRADYRALAAAP